MPHSGMSVMGSPKDESINRPFSSLSVNPKPDLQGYDHITWYVGNAKMVASYFVTRFGFQRMAYQGLETGSRYTSSHVISNGGAVFVLTSPIQSLESNENIGMAEKTKLQEMYKHLEAHGDGVKDVAFQVDDVHAVYNFAVAHGATSIQLPISVHDKLDGEITTAVIKTYGDTTHTLVDRSKYRGSFLPGFRSCNEKDPLEMYYPTVSVEVIDHFVGNQDWEGMEAVCEYYEKCLGFHRFWSADDAQMCSEFSAMNSVVMASDNEVVKMPVNEPALGKRKSQIEEFVNFFGGAGVQHIAFRTNDIVTCVTNLQQRGVEFISIPDTYYNAMSKKLQGSDIHVKEDFEAIRRLNLLIDFDEGGYLLQIFTKPLSDRPTIFLEIIQRDNFNGFGAGNFKSLFEAIERQQAERGNL